MDGGIERSKRQDTVAPYEHPNEHVVVPPSVVDHGFEEGPVSNPQEAGTQRKYFRVMPDQSPPGFSGLIYTPDPNADDTNSFLHEPTGLRLRPATDAERAQMTQDQQAGIGSGAEALPRSAVTRLTAATIEPVAPGQGENTEILAARRMAEAAQYTDAHTPANPSAAADAVPATVAISANEAEGSVADQVERSTASGGNGAGGNGAGGGGGGGDGGEDRPGVGGGEGEELNPNQFVPRYGTGVDRYRILGWEHLQRPGTFFTQEQRDEILNTDRERTIRPARTAPRNTTGEGENPRRDNAREDTQATAGRSERGDMGRPRRAGEITRPDVVTQDAQRVVLPDWTKPLELPIGMKAKTLREIQNDPQTESLFNHLLKNLDGQSGGKFTEVYAKAVAGELLSEQDEALIAYARHEYTIRTQMGERLRGAVNSQDVEVGKKRNAAFRNIVDLQGTEYTKGVIEEQAMILAMKLPREKVETYVGAVNGLDKNRNTSTYRRWENEVKSVLRRSKTDWADYEKTFKVGDREDHEAHVDRVQADIRKDWGMFRKALDIVDFASIGKSRSRYNAEKIINREDAKDREASIDRVEANIVKDWGKFRRLFNVTGSMYKAQGLVREAERLDKKANKNLTLKQVNEALESVTEFMSLTLSHDPEVRRALQQGAFRAEDIQPVRSGVQTFKQAQAMFLGYERSPLAQDSLSRTWDAKRRSVPDWNQKTDVQRREIRDSFEPAGLPQRAAPAEVARSGFFSFLGGVLAALAAVIMGSRREDLSLDNV